ncbi:uncharacterized protein LOC111319021, partial [Stylophora pistillata]|uniref:uncharacterized protein LOC111319021 n=1 Tax=Stylophora pistillata TaxID=50429 RepID=UPI000C044B04
KLGLIFKEASSRKINPQHEYHFFHKTFQEYLAALYLAPKLLNGKVNVFRDLKLKFREVTSKYNQVFLFVFRMLGEDANTLFDHIAENLQMTDWDWPNCTRQEATFFIECFSENRNAEQMAVTLCSYVPFPGSIFIDMRENSLRAFPSVVNDCKSFTQLQLPVNLTVFDSDARVPPGFRDYPVIEDWGYTVGDDPDEFLASYSSLETIVVSNFHEDIDVTPAVCSALKVNLSLHSFTFERHFPFSSEEAVAIGDSLAANKALQTTTLKLFGENWTTVLEKGLCGESLLTSVVLEISGSVRESEKKPLKKLLLKRSLKSLSLAFYGDMHDSLATSIGEGLATNPFLQSLTLIVSGSVSCSAFTSLKMGVLGNSALKSLDLKVFGGLPDNWVNISEALYAAKRSSSLSLTIKPDVVGKIRTQQVARCLRPFRNERVGAFKLHSFTVNMWGELSCSGASDLCKLLIASRVSCVNLNIHGRVT